MSENLRPRPVTLGLLAILLVLLVYALAAVARTAPPPQEPPVSATAPPGDTPGGEGPGGGWEEVDRLVSEDKLEAASRLVAEIKTGARERGDEPEWTRALVREVQLRMALHGYETAVRFLAEEPWSEDPRQRAVLQLYYAQSLATYLSAYSWEIRQRERVETGEVVDLKAWTREQIFAAAQEAFLEVWRHREGWGASPLGELAEYFQQNNYPPRIRGTLRDTVTYLYADLLSDTSSWSPRQSNEIFRLDLPALLSAAGGEAAVEDPAAHPLEKIAALLGDLEAWHRGGGRPEAAFEGRRERLVRLRASFTRAEDRREIRRELERSLDELGRRYGWWSLGMATRAEMVREEEDPEALVRARQIALEGERAHPDSTGGRRCRHIAAAIEAPAYSLAAMTADGPGRRSIQVSHKNLDALHFRAYPLDLPVTVEGARDYNLLPYWQEVQEIVDTRRAAASWSVELPATPDYRVHRTFVTPPLTEPGLYVVAASARRDFGERLNRASAVHFLLTDLVLVMRHQGDRLEVTARSGASGDPLAGAEVSLYRYDWQRGHHRIAAESTGADGRVRFSLPEGMRGNHFLLARRGEHFALEGRTYWSFVHRPPAERTACLVYTDRSIYRPLQEVLWKAVAYRGDGEEGRLRTLPGQTVTVELLDPNRQVVASAEVRTNDFGTASGSFDIPPGRLLGLWSLRTSLSGGAQIRVEEYKRPTFEVTVAEPEAPLRLNRPATLGGEARYYFGLP